MATENIEALEPTLRATLRTQITNEYGVVKTLKQEAEMTIAALIDIGTLATDQEVVDNGGGVTIDIDPTLAADSDEVVASQKAVKAYADALVVAAAGMNFQGAIDCSANPNYPAGVVGDTYNISVAGKIGGGSGTAVIVGSLVICLNDNAGGTEASVGADWTVIQTLAGSGDLSSGGPLGSPSSGDLSHCTGYLIANLAEIDSSVVDAMKLPVNAPGGLVTAPNS